MHDWQEGEWLMRRITNVHFVAYTDKEKHGLVKPAIPSNLSKEIPSKLHCQSR